MASLMPLGLDLCNAESQDFCDVVPIFIQDLHISICHSNMCFLLGPLTVELLEVHDPRLSLCI